MSKPNSATTKFETRGIYAACYRGRSASLASTLTHLVGVDAEGEIVKSWGCYRAENVCDGEPGETAGRPTCPKCAARWDKLTK